MSKPAITLEVQLDLLKSRGLVVNDEAFALNCLLHHNYYRLSAYRFPYTVAGNRDQFKLDTTFDQIWKLYCFDRGLRYLLSEACKRVEISVRSRWAYEVGHQLGPLAYVESRHFRDPLIHARTLIKIDGEIGRSKETFIQHHRGTLAMPWPPSWVVVEVASFGTISNLLGQIQPPQLRQSIADTYHLDEKTFCSFFHHLSVLRNTIAHHGRIWNRKYVITFQLPRKKPPHLHPNFHEHPTDKDRKLYNTLILLIHMLQVIDRDTDWPLRLVGHLRTLDPHLIPDMGFPVDWETRPLWKPLLS